METYQDFIAKRERISLRKGFEPIWMPEFLYDFQTHLVEWALRMGRSALFEDCGLGKSPQSLVWSENVLRKTNRPVLIVAPLAVSHQFVREGKKFDIEVHRSKDGTVRKGINTTNYERLSKFDPNDFSGIVCDESSILKNMDGKIRKQATDFCRKVDYCLLCTATPSPNDYMELGTSSEALGVMDYHKMLGVFFTNTGKTTQQWELKGHARRRFWKWLVTWSRAVRRPSDLGFDDDGFILPKLNIVQHTVETKDRVGFLPKVANTLNEQRDERRKTLRSRCEKVAEIIPENRPFIAWCHLDTEGDLLEKIIDDSVQVAGRDSDEVKEERLRAFSEGQIRILVTKPSIAGFGLNWQHCSDVSFFPSHSHESFYQAIRRCYRFGQKREVVCSIITSQGESRVVSNMKRKEKQAIEMYEGIIRNMGSVIKEQPSNGRVKSMELPKWI